MSKNETQGQVLTIQAHASSTFSVVQIMRQLSAVRAQAARVMPVFAPEPSPAQDTAALQCRVTTPQYRECSPAVGMFPHCSVSAVCCLSYCIVLCNVSNIVQAGLVDTLDTQQL